MVLFGGQPESIPIHLNCLSYCVVSNIIIWELVQGLQTIVLIYLSYAIEPVLVIGVFRTDYNCDWRHLRPTT